MIQDIAFKTISSSAEKAITGNRRWILERFEHFLQHILSAIVFPSSTF